MVYLLLTDKSPCLLLLYTNVYYLCIVSLKMMNQEKELKAQIKQIDNNLLFYSSYWDLLLSQGIRQEELMRRLDVLLDKRLTLKNELKG